MSRCTFGALSGDVTRRRFPEQRTDETETTDDRLPRETVVRRASGALRTEGMSPMKKQSILLAMVMSLVLAACDTGGQTVSGGGGSSSADELTNEEKAGYALGALGSSVTKIDWSQLSGSLDNVSLQGTSLDLGRIVDNDTMTVDASVDVLRTRVLLVISLDEYVLAEGQTVSGTLELGLAYKKSLFSQSIVVTANTPAEDPLVFHGGKMDGHTMGFRDLELTYRQAQIQLGEPASVKGTVLVDGLPVPVNSEIIALIVKFL